MCNNVAGRGYILVNGGFILDTEKFFEQIKSKLIVGLQNATLQDFKEYLDWAMPHYRIISELNVIEESFYHLKLKEVSEALVATPSEIKKTEPIEELSIIEQPKLEIKNEVKEEPKPEEQFPFGVDHTIALKAYGAVIQEMNYPIPEEVVRNMDLKNGYKVRVKGTNGTFFDNRPKYDFEVVDATEIKNPILIEIKQGKVSEAAGRLVITETIYGSLGKDDQHICLFISEKDAQRKGKVIKKDDIVDGRYYKNNVNSFRVSQVYDTDTTSNNESIESRKLLHRQNNPMTNESGFSMLDRLDQTPFIGLKILLIGLRSRVSDFAQLIEKCEDVNMIHLDGYEHKMRIRAQIQKADYVIVSTYENSHDATKYTAKICNEYNIPMTATHSDGFMSVLRDTKELIDQTRKNVTVSKGA